MVRPSDHFVTPARLPPPARRSLYAAAAFSAGLLLARHLPRVDSLWWFVIAAALAALAIVPRGASSRVLLALALAASAGGWFTFRALERPADDIARLLTETPSLICVEGMVIEAPRTRTERTGRLGPLLPRIERSTLARLEVSAVRRSDGHFAPACGELQLFIGGDASGLRAGDRLRATGMSRAVRPATNPGEPDRLLWACATGRSGSMEFESAEALEPASAEPSAWQSWLISWRRFSAAVRARASAWLEDDTAPGDSDRALMRALFLGQREESLRDLGDAFTRLGLAHVLAISGLHLALLAWALRQVVRFPGARPWPEALAVALLIALYLLVVPVRAPVLRAAIGAIGFLIADASGRRYDNLTTLGWVYIATLLWQPMELWSAGFQLSFGVVAALLTLQHPLRAKLFGPAPSPDTLSLMGTMTQRLKDSVAAALTAWLIASPVVAYHMGIFSPLGAPATVLTMPLVFLLMVVGYGAMLVTTLTPALRDVVQPPATALADALSSVVHHLDASPGVALRLPPISLPLTLVMLLCCVWWLAPLRFDVSRFALRARWALTGLSAAWLAAACLFTRLPSEIALRLDSIDVGDGSCHLIRSGADAMLYDCGSLRLAMGERAIPQSLRALGVWRIRTVILSHPNIDHYSALLDVAEDFGVKETLVGRATLEAAERNPGGPVDVTLSTLRARGVEIREISAGESWTLGAARVEIISPKADARWSFDNDASLITLVTAPHAQGEHRLLLCGDVQRRGMAWTLEARPDLRVDVLEAPHHGSAHAAAFDFVKDLAPSIVVQSSGERRLNDPRWDDVRANVQWWATPAHGAISVLMRRDGEREVRSWRSQYRAPLPSVTASAPR